MLVRSSAFRLLSRVSGEDIGRRRCAYLQFSRNSSVIMVSSRGRGRPHSGDVRSPDPCHRRRSVTEILVGFMIDWHRGRSGPIREQDLLL
jgi:hypothetical protein